jgi:hypothetical protein
VKKKRRERREEGKRNEKCYEKKVFSSKQKPQIQQIVVMTEINVKSEIMKQVRKIFITENHIKIAENYRE